MLVACSAYGINPITPTRAMVTGTWVHNGGAVLVLSKNGTFAGRDMPLFFGEESVGPTPRAGSGTWHVGHIVGDYPVGIVLDFAPPSRTQDELLVENCCGLPLTVYYDRGDPDEGISGQYQLTRRRP